MVKSASEHCDLLLNHQPRYLLFEIINYKITNSYFISCTMFIFDIIIHIGDYINVHVYYKLYTIMYQVYTNCQHGNCWINNSTHKFNKNVSHIGVYKINNIMCTLFIYGKHSYNEAI